MDGQALGGCFENISQRVVNSYLRSLTREGSFSPDAGRSDLRAFFGALYAELFRSPQQFGLPVGADAWIDETPTDASLDMQEVNRRLKKPRELLAGGLAFLFQAGQEGRLDGQALALTREQVEAGYPASKTGRLFVNGMQQAGLLAVADGDPVRLTSPRFPAMIPALQALARGCAQAESNGLSRFHFARCDFRALAPDYRLDPVDLFQIFNPVDAARLIHLHEFFVGLGYKPQVKVQDISSWLVAYQSRKQIKATPLFQVEYQDRRQDPLMVFIKCASTNRIAPLLNDQSDRLRADFFARAFPCRGKDCGWCKTRKGLGPSEIEYGGQRKIACWYSNPDMPHLTGAGVELIKQYGIMHEALAPL